MDKIQEIDYMQETVEMITHENKTKPETPANLNVRCQAKAQIPDEFYLRQQKEKQWLNQRLVIKTVINILAKNFNGNYFDEIVKELRNILEKTSIQRIASKDIVQELVKDLMDVVVQCASNNSTKSDPYFDGSSLLTSLLAMSSAFNVQLPRKVREDLEYYYIVSLDMMIKVPPSHVEVPIVNWMERM